MAYIGSYLWSLRQKIGSGLVLLPGASILVENTKGQILLTRRTDSDIWCMPGGGAEIGSSFLSIALMELKEEVGIVAEADELEAFACISDPEIHILSYPNGDQTHAFALWFALRNWGGKVEIGDEVREVRFFERDAIPLNTLKPSKVAITLYERYKKTGKFQVS